MMPSLLLQGFAEFLVRAPAEVAPGVFTQHYSRPYRVEPAINSVLSLDE